MVSNALRFGAMLTVIFYKECPMNMQRVCFVDEYTAQELDRGLRMNFHPVTGERLTELSYIPGLRTFVRWVAQGGWDWDPDMHPRARISVGVAVRIGDPYPAHWEFDPWTAEPL